MYQDLGTAVGKKTEFLRAENPALRGFIASGIVAIMAQREGEAVLGLDTWLLMWCLLGHVKS